MLGQFPLVRGVAAAQSFEAVHADAATAESRELDRGASMMLGLGRARAPLARAQALLAQFTDGGSCTSLHWWDG